MGRVVHSRLRLTILGGSLDRDKAGWLAEQLEAGVFGDALVVFSDAAPSAFTALLPDLRVHVLPKGCACCGGKSELIAGLRDIVKNRHASSMPIDGIVLEAGGNSDLSEIASAIANDPILEHHVLIAELVVALAGSEDLRMLHDLPMLARQIETADCVVMTKPQSRHPEFEDTIRSLNRSVPIFGGDSA